MWFPAHVRLLPLTEEQAREISGWHFDGDHAAYGVLGKDPGSQLHDYLGAWEDIDGRDLLVGFVVVGQDARVRGLPAREGVLDIRIGVHPGFTGKGLGVSLAEAALSHAHETLGARHLRAAVQSWNLRSQALCFRMGFHVAGQHTAVQEDATHTTYEVFMRSIA
jgi:[ribosomal protein S18]-alanine N-acetyltransferase